MNDNVYIHESNLYKINTLYNNKQRELAILREGLLSLLCSLPVDLFDSSDDYNDVINNITSSYSHSDIHIVYILDILYEKLDKLNKIVIAGELQRNEYDRLAHEQKKQKELALQQRVAADLAEKMKILTRRNNNLGINRIQHTEYNNGVNTRNTDTDKDTDKDKNTDTQQSYKQDNNIDKQQDNIQFDINEIERELHQQHNIQQLQTTSNSNE